MKARGAGMPLLSQLFRSLSISSPIIFTCHSHSLLVALGLQEMESISVLYILEYGNAFRVVTSVSFFLACPVSSLTSSLIITCKLQKVGEGREWVGRVGVHSPCHVFPLILLSKDGE